MILRLLPFLFVFAFGFFVGMMVFVRRGEAKGGEDWEVKYRDLYQRYRDLTQRLGKVDEHADLKASRLRQTLWDVRGMLNDPERLSPDRARSALTEIEAALNETE